MAKKKEPDRLDIESSAAIAAGMSYGKWKAMQTPTVKAPEKPKQCFTRHICEHCGVEFVQFDNRKRKYCGEPCQRAANDKNYKRRCKNGKM